MPRSAVERESMLLAALEAAQLGIWHRGSGSEMSWGGRPTSILSSTGSADGTTFDDVVRSIHPDDHEGFLAAIGEAQQKASAFALEFRVLRPDGEIRWIAAWGQFLSGEDEASRQSVGVFRDVTEQRLLEHQLAQAHRVEAIGNLAAGVAHEINTPIQYVGDNLRFLEDGFQSLARLIALQTAALDAPTEEKRAEILALKEEIDLEYLLDESPQALRQARDGVNRVTEIVRAVKSFSHPGSAQRVDVDLNEVIRNTLTLSRNEWKYAADVQTDLDADLPPVQAVRTEIQQAILNLVINAAHAIVDAKRASGRSGLITIKTRNLGAEIELSVTDTGTGIPETIRPRIFDLFFTTKEIGTGSGQGLPLVHDVIVKKHGGSIWFETALGQGTAFFVRLPLARAASGVS